MMKNRGLIITAAVAALLVCVVVGAKVWLRHSVRSAVEKALSGTGADVKFGCVTVSLSRRSVSVHNVRVKAQSNDPGHRGFTVVSLDATVPVITAHGVGYERVGDRPTITADSLVIEESQVELVTLDGEKTARLFAGGAALSVHDFRSDSLPADIYFAADSIVYGFGDGAQVVRADSVMVDTASGMLTAASFALEPQYSKDEFALCTKNHTDWTAVTLGGIACIGVDFGRLFSRRAIAIDSIRLASVEVSSYKNRNIFSPPSPKPMLYESIQHLPIPLDIKILSFENLDITYDELAEKSDTPGTVTITGGRGLAVNLTNIADGHDRFMTVDVAATLMQGGALEAQFLFPVAPADDSWEFKGRLGPTDISVFNGVITPLMSARIVSGKIQSFDFHIAGTLTKSQARLTMAYNDLQVAFLDPHDPSRERKFLTVMADDVFLHPDNPRLDDRGRLREATGEYTRDPERSMWNYIWHSLLPAILKTVA